MAETGGPAPWAARNGLGLGDPDQTLAGHKPPAGGKRRITSRKGGQPSSCGPRLGQTRPEAQPVIAPAVNSCHQFLRLDHRGGRTITQVLDRPPARPYLASARMAG